MSQQLSIAFTKQLETFNSKSFKKRTAAAGKQKHVWQVVLLTFVGDCCRRAGIDLATVEVRMNQLKVEANIAVGSRGNPTVTNTLLNMADVRL